MTGYFKQVVDIQCTSTLQTLITNPSIDRTPSGLLISLLVYHSEVLQVSSYSPELTNIQVIASCDLWILQL